MSELNANNEVMNVDEVSELLHTNIEIIYDLSNTGSMPATQVGRKWIYMRSVLMTWLEERMHKDMAKIKQKKTKGYKAKNGIQSATLSPAALQKLDAKKQLNVV